MAFSHLVDQIGPDTYCQLTEEVQTMAVDWPEHLVLVGITDKAPQTTALHLIDLNGNVFVSYASLEGSLKLRGIFWKKIKCLFPYTSSCHWKPENTYSGGGGRVAWKWAPLQSCPEKHHQGCQFGCLGISFPWTSKSKQCTILCTQCCPLLA